ncbi:MAG: DUF3788 domain-containing protein [Bacteroidetes bacterium]|nr:DUF3788 domain-containing protein [Bacteroidota bacterium]
MDTSIFTDKTHIPSNNDLLISLGETYPIWHIIKEYVCLKYSTANEEWNYSGEKYGWSFRIKDKKRVILYLLPRHQHFKVAFVFGQKSTDIILKSHVSETIKNQLQSAKQYAEGRGIRIEIKNENQLNDIKELINIKLSN